MDGLTSLLEGFAPGVLWLIFLVVVLFTVVVAVALSYHWREYTTDVKRSNLMFRGYLVIASIFILVMVAAIFLY